MIRAGLVFTMAMNASLLPCQYIWLKYHTSVCHGQPLNVANIHTRLGCLQGTSAISSSLYTVPVLYCAHISVPCTLFVYIFYQSQITVS